MKWRWLAVGILVFMLFSSMSVGIHGINAHENLYERNAGTFGQVVDIDGVRYNAHDVIRINNDTDFAKQASVNGWPGDGTQGNPYIISGYDIDAHGAGDAIYIGNTTVYFIIKNSYMHNTSPVSNPYFGGLGIELYNVTNGVIENNTCSENLIGILFDESSNSTISNNSCYKNMAGMEFYSSSNNNTVTNNTCNNNSLNGIILESSSDDVLSSNTCLHNGYNGIFLDFSGNSTLHNNTCSYNNVGLYIYSSSMNEVYSNVFVNNTGYGVHIVSGSKNLIYKNAFFYNNGTGDKFNSAYIQADDDGSNNSWNTTGGIGNYWRDWANNNDTNYHGDVVKWPYRTSGSAGAEDYYPLKNTTVKLPPLAPRDLNFTVGNGYVYLTWKAPRGNGTSPITYYRVYRNGVLLASVSVSQLYYNDTDVVGGQTYMYYVTAVSSAGESDKSNEVSATPGGEVPELQVFMLPVIALMLVLWVLKIRRRN